MTRRGKIARLPHQIREEINSRLHDGEEAKSLLPWLNSLPAVNSVLTKHFDGSPINEVNLSDWKLGGYKDWLLRHDAMELAEDIDDPHLLGPEKLECLCANLVQWVTIQYASVAKSLIFDDLDPKIKRARLRELCADVTLLYRAQLAAERVAQKDYWIDRQEDKDLQNLKDKVQGQERFLRLFQATQKPKPSTKSAKAKPDPTKPTSPPTE